MAFFRVMLPRAIQDKKLKLPVKFARLHGGKLAERARLSLPNGRNWDVGVVKGPEEGQFWFENGWSLFVEQNSVKEYWFLAFEHTGPSSFKVRIFDLTTCEIDYPSAGFVNDVEEEDDSSVQILESPPPNPTPKQNPESDSVQPRKKIKNSNNATTSRNLSKPYDSVDSADGDEEEDDEAGDGELGETLVKELKRRRIFVNSKLSKELPKLSIQNQRAVEEAIAMKRGNEPSFLVMIQRHNRKPQPRLIPPLAFVNEHQQMENAESVRLKLAMGGNDAKWDVDVIRYSAKGPCLYGKGFSKFYKENDLKLGDVCLFEMLLSEGNVVFQVSIARVLKKGFPSLEEVICLDD
ncbi:unnamed protein product [Linum tenue]|uniref:TF-B3 domain-containing protein n=1 Tax=Linum tenue TaxID=586396 RepID=A0AAV0JA25_9ROSI|nr:unnamed protein product [Linum tenue]